MDTRVQVEDFRRAYITAHDEPAFCLWLSDALQGHGDDWSWAVLAKLMSERIER